MKLPFFRKKRDEKDPIITRPHHVAIIMDGNGRWAKNKGLPRHEGHKEGMKVVRKVALEARKHQIKTLTLYAFSTENWQRPQCEVDYLMDLPSEFLQTYLSELIENNIKIDTIGETADLPMRTKKAISYAKDKTKENDGLLLNFALNYGSRIEIMQAIKQVMTDVKDAKISIDKIDEQTFSNYLYTNGLSDPDLLIRTSGEQRLSNFLLWQLAYTEFWFTDVLWPDFNEHLFQQALFDYTKRKRRFGGI